MWLRQSTAGQEVLIGPFLDSTDGNTQETALTINNTDVKLWKEGATTEANKNLGGATHIANGRYYLVLDATDTNTLGKLEINIHVTGALAVRREYDVVPAMIYDSIILGTDRLDTNVTHVADTAQTANDNGADINTILSRIIGTLAAGTHTAQSADHAANISAILTDTGTTLENHLTDIKGATFAGATDSLEAIRNQGDASWITATGFSTHSAADVWAVATRTLTANTNFNDPTAAAIAIAVWNALQASHTTAGTFGEIATEIATLLTNLATVKAKTDSLTFTKANELDSNIQSINDVTITGDGSATPFDV